MIKGLAITPPVIGRISIGRIIEKDGKRLPEKDDQFTLTSQIQNRDGWILHPMDETLRKSSGGKLRTLPVRMLFDEPALNLRASYTLFDRQTGRPVCMGDGQTCRRARPDGMETLPCRGPDLCSLGQAAGCKLYGRLNVLIGDEDELGSFIFRTTSYNSVRTLYARLKYYRAVSGDRLACLPLELKLRGKSTIQGLRPPIYYVDLVARGGEDLVTAIQQSRKTREHRIAAGFDQTALDAAAREGLANGAFEDGPDEVAELIETLESGAGEEISRTSTSLDEDDHRRLTEGAEPAATLRDKLDKKAKAAIRNR